MPTYKRDGGYRDIGCPSNAIEKGSRLLERIFGRSRKRYQSASPALWIHLYNYRSLIRRLFPTHFPIRFPLTCFPRLWTMYVHICVSDPLGRFGSHDEDVPQNENLGIVGGNLLSMLDRTFIFFPSYRCSWPCFSLFFVQFSFSYRKKQRRTQSYCRFGIFPLPPELIARFRFQDVPPIRDNVSHKLTWIYRPYNELFHRNVSSILSLWLVRRFYLFLFLAGGINGVVRIGVWV